MKIKPRRFRALAGTALFTSAGVIALMGAGAGATTLAAPAAPATTAPSSTPGPTTCTIGHDGEWPDFATGMPKNFEAGAKAGVYLWHNTDGWHLRVTHVNDKHRTYSGEITTGGTITDVSAVKVEKNDHHELGPNGHALTFKFNNYGGVDGLDFRTSCAPRLHVELRADGNILPTENVFIGHGSTNPTSVPFVIERAL